MKHSIIILLISLTFSFAATAQEDYEMLQLPDSLVGKLRENRGTDLNRAKALDDAIMFYYDNQRIADAKGYISELGYVANSLHDNYWIAKSHYFMALYACQTYNNTGFFAHSNKALRIAETLRENEASQLLLAKIHLTRSGNFFTHNLFAEGQESIDKGLEIAEKNGFHSLKNAFLCNSGSLLNQLGKHKDAIAVFKEILKDEFNLIALLNITYSYGRLRQFDSVIYYADSVIRYVTNMEKKNDYAGRMLITAYQQKAAVFMELNLWERAILCLDTSENYMAKYGEKSQYSIGLLHRADALNGMGQYERALETINKAISVASSSKIINNELAAVKLKSEILHNMRAYELEVENLRYSIALTDTLNSRGNVEKIQIQKLQKEVMALEHQYEFQQAAIQQKHRLIWLSLTFLLVVSVLVAIIFILNRKRKLETMADVLDTRNREVTSKTMEQMHLNQVLQEMVTKLTHSPNNLKDNDNTVDVTIRNLKSLIDDGSVKDFDYFFTQVHPDFYKKLQADYPDLTANNLRLCAYIKSNLNVKEIAELTGISANSVKTARSRLRKKLGITDPNTSLTAFLGKY